MHKQADTTAVQEALDPCDTVSNATSEDVCQLHQSLMLLWACWSSEAETTIKVLHGKINYIFILDIK